MRQLSITEQGRPCTAVILDRHPLWLDAVELVLGRLGIDVLCKTTSPASVLARIEESRPDVFVTGVTMNEGEMDGIACVRQARERVPTLKAIVLSGHSDLEHIEASLAAGAFAYVIKTAHSDDFAAAVRQAFEHSIYLPPLRYEHAPAARPVANESVGLTPREVEILRLAAEGYSNAQLAKMLWVTEQTVKFHLSNIYRKLSVSNRTEAGRWAEIHGLLDRKAASASTG